MGVPTWGNYSPLFQHAGFTNFQTYTYLDGGQIDPTKPIEALLSAPEQSIFIFQGCCHNPTGRDYNPSQWYNILKAVLEKRHFAFFDVAYQGLGCLKADGGADDVRALREFANKGANMLVCQSFSKNMGLYSERVGALHVVCQSSEIAENVQDQLRALTRWEISSAPAYGASHADIIMNNPGLEAEWKQNLFQACESITARRKEFHRLLTNDCEPISNTRSRWSHIIEESGLFSYTNLTRAQVQYLISRHNIYLPDNGRINVTGLNATNIGRAAEAFRTALKEVR